MKIGRLTYPTHMGFSLVLEDVELEPGDLEKVERIISSMISLEKIRKFRTPPQLYTKPKCQWMGCQEPATQEIMSLPGGSALKIHLCKKHAEELDKLLHPKQNTLPEAADYKE